MKRLTVLFNGWGEHWPLGTLADNGHDILFESAPEAVQRGLELSPRHLPLRAAAYGGFPRHQQTLPGLLADSLPDGWGMLLMDKLFRKQGRPLHSISPLDRLAFVGERGMGALSYMPPEPQQLTPEDLRLPDLAKERKHSRREKTAPSSSNWRCWVVAADSALPARRAVEMIDAMASQAGLFTRLAAHAPIRAASVKAIAAAIRANRERLK